MDNSSSRLVINVSHLPVDGEKLKGELPAAIFAMNTDERLSFPHPLCYQLRLEMAEQTLCVTGNVWTTIDCRCDRCWAFFQPQLRADNVGHMYPVPGDHLVDLTEDIREDILLQLPLKFLCQSSCLGLCPHCGQNLNLTACNCKMRKSREDQWSVLDQLNL